MNYFLRLLLILPAILLAGCCANNVLSCNDLLADSLYFRFDTSQFQVSDIDTVYLFRYSNTDTLKAIDSVQLTRRQLYVNVKKLRENGQLPATFDTDSSIVILSNNAPFSPTTTGGKLSQFNYRLSVPKGDARYAATGSTQTRPVYDYRISAIVIKGQYQADGCNTCYENTKKTFTVRKTFFDATENDGSGGSGGQPEPVVLHR